MSAKHHAKRKFRLSDLLKNLIHFFYRHSAVDLATDAQPESTIADQLPHHKEVVEFSQAKTFWLFGEWHRLVELENEDVQKHPERAIIALLIASAHQQQDDHDRARSWVKQALNWGCPPRSVAQILVAGVHNTLGRIAALHEDSERVEKHFKNAISAAETDDAE